jgi:hypothetical protein
MACPLHLCRTPPGTVEQKKIAGVGRRRMTMKNLVSCVAVIFVVALSLVSAQAQTKQMLKADIPFDFVIGNSYATSGTYYVENAGNEAQLIRRATDNRSQFLITNPMSNPKERSGKCVLKFHRYGSEYFLAEIWQGDVGHQLRVTKREGQLARVQAPELTLIAMDFSK